MLICPGFIDAHTHWPQWDVVGYDGMPLLDWLEQIVFPAEGRWSDGAVVEYGSEKALRTMLAGGTTGCAAFLTSHAHAVSGALAALARYPVRSIIGRVLMDREAPPDLCFDCSDWTQADVGQPALRASGLTERVSLSINPRFAVSCSEQALTAAGRLAAEAQRFVHTHLAETLRECDRVRELFGTGLSYLEVYERFGLLGVRTLLAHALHLSEKDWALAKARNVVLVHCPTANVFLESGVFDWDAAIRHGVRTALGSDVAAGPDASMPRVARAVIETCKWRRRMAHVAGHRGDEVWVPSAADVWRMITSGNADALGFNDAGRIEPGAAADLLLLHPGRAFSFDASDSHLIARLLYNWTDDMIEHVILNGRLISRSELTRLR